MDTKNILLIAMIFPFLLKLVSSSNMSCSGEVIMFVFGDSNSDTGGAGSAYGGVSAYPNGRIFPQPRPPSTRASDGRLIIDFICEHVGTPYLNAYLDATTANFNNGVNFAVAGADTHTTIFHLGMQFNQFRRIMNRSLESGAIGLVPKQGFTCGLYIIDIGQNDLSRIASSKDATTNATFIHSEIIRSIQSIETLITSLYQYGARHFWVHNTGPLGCLPSLDQSKSNASAVLDPNGCVIYLNQVAQQFNNELAILCNQLRAQMSNTSIVYVDTYTVKYDLIANHTLYGFDDPFTPCRRKSYTCEKEHHYINWDGGHYTDAANGFVASKLISGYYNMPPIPFHL